MFARCLPRVVCFGVAVNGVPRTFSDDDPYSNKLCATNGENGIISPSNPDTCKDATLDGLIALTVCDEHCIQIRCMDEPRCKGYAIDNQGNVRLVSFIATISNSDKWKTTRKTNCQGII